MNDDELNQAQNAQQHDTVERQQRLTDAWKRIKEELAHGEFADCVTHEDIQIVESELRLLL